MGLFIYLYISKHDNSTEEHRIFEDSTLRSLLLVTWERGFNRIAPKKSLGFEGSSS